MSRASTVMTGTSAVILLAQVVEGAAPGPRDSEREAGVAPSTTGQTVVNLRGAMSALEDRARPWMRNAYDQLVRVEHAVGARDTFHLGRSPGVPAAGS